MFAFYPVEGSEVSIQGVGIPTSDGIPLERAAQAMNELQRFDAETQTFEPLDGDDLVKAARSWADRAGFVVAEHGGVEASVSPAPAFAAEMPSAAIDGSGAATLAAPVNLAAPATPAETKPADVPKISGKGASAAATLEPVIPADETSHQEG